MYARMPGRGGWWDPALLLLIRRRRWLGLDGVRIRLEMAAGGRNRFAVVGVLMGTQGSAADGATCSPTADKHLSPPRCSPARQPPLSPPPRRWSLASSLDRREKWKLGTGENRLVS